LRGLTTAGRIVQLIDELQTKIGRHYLVINRAAGPLSDEQHALIEQYGLNLIAVVPADEQVAEYDAIGRPMTELPVENPVWSAVREVTDTILSAVPAK
jgi:CO dehydrogenase nickel-insertion accessory protein CooC1